MSADIDFPAPIRIKGRLYFAASDLEAYKRKIVAAALNSEPAPYIHTGPETFVPAPQVAKDFGVSRRTIGRRVRAHTGQPEQKAA
jgi:hypothetical protein